MARTRTLLISLVAVAAAAVVAAAGPGAAQGQNKKAGKGKDASLTGDQIVERMLDQDPLGYGGAEARVLMVLANNRGQQRKRNLVMLSRVDGDTRRMFVRFTSPADIAGTAFLGIDDDGDRVQHLFLPALAKTRRISGSQRNASFVGTDFSYADMDNRDVEDATKKRLPDQEIAGRPVYVVEAIPTDKESAYGRIVLFIGKETWLPLRIQFFDGRGNEIKRLTTNEVKKVENRWVIMESKMADLKREHATLLKVLEIDLRDDIPLEQFTVRALERE